MTEAQLKRHDELRTKVMKRGNAGAEEILEYFKLAELWDKHKEQEYIKNRRTGRHQVGVVGVDAGLCWIGDPCYVLHADPKPKAIGEDWRGFAEKLYENQDEYAQANQFNYDHGHAGLGVCVRSGDGDGTYPVFAEYKDGRVASVTVVFIGDDEDEEDEDD